MGIYWLVWFVVSFLTFIIPEVYVLATGRSQLTLSSYIWALEDVTPGQFSPIWLWPAAHYLIGGAIAVALTWLFFHFLFGMFA